MKKTNKHKKLFMTPLTAGLLILAAVIVFIVVLRPLVFKKPQCYGLYLGHK
jgi:UDP-N-acetylmuramyl pentapeptide phosphotransferase/UDP-N-acetylglucosamine-1-phosphate transferase